MTVEVFGFSLSAGVPDLYIATFGSRLANRKAVKDNVPLAASVAYLERQPYDEAWFIQPLEEGD